MVFSKNKLKNTSEQTKKYLEDNATKLKTYNQF